MTAVVAAVAIAVTTRTVSHVAVVLVEEKVESSLLMMTPSQLSEPSPSATAVPKKVRVKYLVHAHAFSCGAE